MNSNWSYSPETVNLGCDLCDLDLWPWPFAWMSLVITHENFMMIRWWEHSQKGVTDGRTDGQTDRRTDGQTENTICRAAWSQLKTIGHLFCATSNPLVNSNLSYSPETPNLGQIWRFLELCEVEIWRMTLQNNRAPLLCYFRICASFLTHWWIQTWVTVRKRLIWVKFDDFFSRATLKFDRWPCKTIGHLFNATSSFCIISYPLVN